ncbi:MAG: hypothetical protein ACLUDU_12225 [Butyricimonas faecihominis]
MLGALGVLKDRWIVMFFVNRRTNARKEDASADSMETESLNIINSLTQQIERSIIGRKSVMRKLITCTGS